MSSKAYAGLPWSMRQPILLLCSNILHLFSTSIKRDARQLHFWIDARGATAANLFRLWNEVAADYGLDVGKHVAIACDGAAAMIGRRNSLSQKVTAQNPITYTVHCHAHRLALACTDTVKGLQLIQDCKRGLVQTWKHFSISPLKTAKLQEMQTTDVDSSARK